MRLSFLNIHCVDVLATSLNFFTSASTSKALSDPKMYVSAIRSTDRESRWRVQTILTTFTCVAKRSAPLLHSQNGAIVHPFAHLWPMLLPNILSAIRTSKYSKTNAVPQNVVCNYR